MFPGFLLREHAEVGGRQKAQNGMLAVGNHAEYDANELPVGEKTVGGSIFR